MTCAHIYFSGHLNSPIHETVCEEIIQPLGLLEGQVGSHLHLGHLALTFFLKEITISQNIQYSCQKKEEKQYINAVTVRMLIVPSTNNH
jgi:hypothetical protein